MELQSFTFIASLKLNLPHADVAVLQDQLPGIVDFQAQSRTFSSYTECVLSCKQLMDDFLKKANGASERFRIGSEINPLFSGEPTLSKDWSTGEVARMWVFEIGAEKGGHISAIGQAKIFGSTIPAPRPALN